MGKVAFIFSGQGAQCSGMGKDLSDNIEESRNIFKAADEALGFKLSELCFSGDASELNKTENTQPAVLTVSIAALMALKAKGYTPDYTAGLSLGEYSALVCSGVFDFSTAVKLVRIRGRLMQQEVAQGVGAMSAIIGLSDEEVKLACKFGSKDGIVETANFNCPGQIVIGGEVLAVKNACEKATELGAARVINLTVSGPFHTSMLKGAAEKLELELNKVDFKEIKIPIITNVTGDFIKDKSEIKGYLKKQVMSPVMWESTIRRMVSLGVDTFVELGPGKVLCSFIKKVDRKLTTLNVEDTKSLQKTIDVLGVSGC